MDDLPLLSIAIATKDREYYCIESVKTMLGMNLEGMEIVIADNSGGNALQEYINEIDSPLIKYTHTSEPLNFIENFNKCIELASGRYVIMIGDDDIVRKEIMQIVRWMMEHNVSSMSTKKYIEYHWPDSNREGLENGSLKVPEFSSNIEISNNNDNLIKLAKYGFVSYLSFPLSKVYHGIIDRNVLIRVKETTGNYFGGASPDIYSCLAISSLVEKNYTIDYPYTISGICAKSGSAIASKTGLASKLEEGVFLKDRKDNYQWDAWVPRFHSVETLWAESAIKSLREMNRNDILRHFNPYVLYIIAYRQNCKFIPEIAKEETLKMIKTRKVSSTNFFINIFINLIFLVTKRVKTKIYTKSDPESYLFTKEKVTHIDDAELVVRNTLAQKGTALDLINNSRVLSNDR
jgi:glycosyltransferase involved in cell wall biosynthesis